MKKKTSCCLKGFSLIELMISLIVISCITAAFAPVVTKKLKNSNVTVGINDFTQISSECEEFGEDCKLCYPSKSCIVCNKVCTETDEYKDSSQCSCKKCSEKFNAGCTKCNSKACTECNSGYNLQNGNCSNCPTGYYSNNGAECKPCQAGTYQNEEGQTSCKNCAAGLWSDEGSSACNITCSAEYSCKDGVKQCAKGYYGSETCTICPKGTYSAVLGATTCSKCSPGTYSTSLGATSSSTCTKCPSGKYSAESGSTSCKSCESGYVVNSSQTGCVSEGPCPSKILGIAKYKKEDGTYSYAGIGCIKECGVGKLSAANTNYDGQGYDYICIYDCSSSGGLLNAAGTACVSSCPAGTYKSSEYSCANCPAGTYSRAANSESCTECKAMYYSLEGATSCRACPTGTFSEAGGTCKSTVCPSGYTYISELNWCSNDSGNITPVTYDASNCPCESGIVKIAYDDSGIKTPSCTASCSEANGELFYEIRLADHATYGGCKICSDHTLRCYYDYNGGVSDRSSYCNNICNANGTILGTGATYSAGTNFSSPNDGTCVMQPSCECKNGTLFALPGILGTLY